MSKPDCSNALVIGLLIVASIAIGAAVAALIYGFAPCGVGFFTTLGFVAVSMGFVGGALIACGEYLNCWGEYDLCPNAANIKKLLEASLAILAITFVSILGGAGVSAGTCAIPFIGVLISLIPSAATTTAAYASLGGAAAMIALAIYLVAEYQKCRNQKYSEGDEDKPKDPPIDPPIYPQGTPDVDRPIGGLHR